MVDDIKRQVWSVMPNAGVDVTAIEEALHRFTLASPRFALAIIGTLAVLAVLLVVTGVFSVMAYVVAFRTREIGIRIAAGADRGDVVRMVLKSALLPVAIGCALGALMSQGLTRFLEGQLWGVSAADPWTWASALAIVVSAGLAASIVPAIRAAAVDPVVALRRE